MSKRKLKIYKDLEDLPIFNWEKSRIDERYLYILPHYKNIEKLPRNKKLAKALEGLIKQYYDHFGLSDEHTSKINTLLRIAELKGMIALGDDFARTLLAVEEMRLKTAPDDNTDTPYRSFTKTVAALEAHLHFQIDQHKMLTIPYYEHYEAMKKKIEREIAARSKR